MNAAGLGVIGAGLYSAAAYLPTYVQMVYSTSASVAGLILLPHVLGVMAANNPSGWLNCPYRAFPLPVPRWLPLPQRACDLLTRHAVAGFRRPSCLLGLAVGSFLQVTVVITDPCGEEMVRIDDNYFLALFHLAYLE